MGQSVCVSRKALHQKSPPEEAKVLRRSCLPESQEGEMAEGK